MPHTLARLLPALLALACATASRAQAPAPTPGDAMTLAQFQARQSERIMAADSDGDGRVSRAEMTAMARNGRDPSRLFDMMDANHDGYLDKAEIQAVLARRFQRMDRNGDGILAADERIAGRTGRRGGAPASGDMADAPDGAAAQPAPVPAQN